MELLPPQPTAIGDPALFRGEVYLDSLTAADNRVRVLMVRFSPGAYNAWHCHVNGQTLHVVDGVGLVQERGKEIQIIEAGDTIWTPAGEWHWHGAAPDRFMTHLAIMEGLAEGQEGLETEWGEFAEVYGYPGM